MFIATNIISIIGFTKKQSSIQTTYCYKTGHGVNILNVYHKSFVIVEVVY